MSAQPIHGARRSWAQAIAHVGLLAGLLALSAPSMAAGPCGNIPCVSTRSVVSAAGDEFRKALAQVEFAGGELAPQSRDALATIARTWTAASKKVLRLRVAADAGLHGAAARSQATARARALKQGLVAAGLPAKQLSVTH